MVCISKASTHLSFFFPNSRMTTAVFQGFQLGKEKHKLLCVVERHLGVSVYCPVPAHAVP